MKKKVGNKTLLLLAFFLVIVVSLGYPFLQGSREGLVNINDLTIDKAISDLSTTKLAIIKSKKLRTTPNIDNAIKALSAIKTNINNINKNIIIAINSIEDAIAFIKLHGRKSSTNLDSVLKSLQAAVK